MLFSKLAIFKPSSKKYAYLSILIYNHYITKSTLFCCRILHFLLFFISFHYIFTSLFPIKCDTIFYFLLTHITYSQLSSYKMLYFLLFFFHLYYTFTLFSPQNTTISSNFCYPILHFSKKILSNITFLLY